VSRKPLQNQDPVEYINCVHDAPGRPLHPNGTEP
jgi:hypothetical protein